METEDFYTSIAPWYDAIFPASMARRDWLSSLLPREGSTVLDLGCATGALLAQLAELGHEVWGMDLDPALVARAKARLPRLEAERLRVKDMMELDQVHAEAFFFLITSFGNTLVHLPSEADIETFFRRVASRLCPGGRFVGQIVNYDRVMAMAVPGLPTVTGEGLRFERDYALRDDGRLDFRTRLIVKDGGEDRLIDNSVPLLPLKRDRLEGLLEAAGFEECRFWADWSFGEWTPDAGPTIWEARRPA